MRPIKHTAGNDFYLVNDPYELVDAINNIDGEWYASEFINKSKEYRVFLVQGKVVNITEKVPHNPGLPIWNVATGNCEFINVKWSDWPLDVAEQAMLAFALSELDFGAVDIIVDTNGIPYVLEVNSAPAMPLLSDGSISYRMKCLAKGIDYIIGTDSKEPLPTTQVTTWKDVVHPAIYSE